MRARRRRAPRAGASCNRHTVLRIFLLHYPLPFAVSVELGRGFFGFVPLAGLVTAVVLYFDTMVTDLRNTSRGIVEYWIGHRPPFQYPAQLSPGA